MIQIASVSQPLATPAMTRSAVSAFARAEAMGLIPETDRVERLDIAALRRLVGYLHEAGIGRTMALELGDDDIESLQRTIQKLNQALEESPSPQHEWQRLSTLFGLERLAQLLTISNTSLRRYRAAARSTPDDVAARLHFLSLVAGDLSGAYNDMGIRQWFGRKRAQLGGRSPSDLLPAGWAPDTEGPQSVRALARSLIASAAT